MRNGHSLQGVIFRPLTPSTDEARTASELTTPSPVRAGHQGILHTRLQAVFILCRASGHSAHAFAGHVHSVHTLQLNIQLLQLILHTLRARPAQSAPGRRLRQWVPRRSNLGYTYLG